MCPIINSCADYTTGMTASHSDPCCQSLSISGNRMTESPRSALGGCSISLATQASFCRCWCGPHPLAESLSWGLQTATPHCGWRAPPARVAARLRPSNSLTLGVPGTDKRSKYSEWWPQVRRVLRPGGLLVADNATSHADEMAPFVALVKADALFKTSVVSVGNGEFLAVKSKPEGLGVNTTDRSRVIRLADAQAHIPGPAGEHAVRLLQRGTLDVALSIPKRPIPQSPHEQDELYVVIRGRGVLLHDGSGTHSSQATLSWPPASTIRSRTLLTTSQCGAFSMARVVVSFPPDDAYAVYEHAA